MPTTTTKVLLVIQVEVEVIEDEYGQPDPQTLATVGDALCDLINASGLATDVPTWDLDLED